MVCQVDSSASSPEPEARTLVSTPARIPFASYQRAESSSWHLGPLTGKQSWSSPAFLKRKHVEANPLFDSALDPSFDEATVTDDRSKKAKLGRLSDQWRFVDRAPSPEKMADGAHEAAFIDEPSAPAESPTAALKEIRSLVAQSSQSPPYAAAVRSGVSPVLTGLLPEAQDHAPPAMAAEARESPTVSIVAPEKSAAASPLPVTLASTLPATGPLASASLAPIHLDSSQFFSQSERPYQDPYIPMEIARQVDPSGTDFTAPLAFVDWQLPSPQSLSGFFNKNTEAFPEQSQRDIAVSEVQYPVLPDANVEGIIPNFNPSTDLQASQPHGLDFGHIPTQGRAPGFALPDSRPGALSRPEAEPLAESDIVSTSSSFIVDRAARTQSAVREEVTVSIDLERSQGQDPSALQEVSSFTQSGKVYRAAGQYQSDENHNDALQPASQPDALGDSDQESRHEPAELGQGTVNIAFSDQNLTENEELETTSEIAEPSHSFSANQAKPTEVIEIESDEDTESSASDESEDGVVDVSQYAESQAGEEDFVGGVEEVGEEKDGLEDQKVSVYDGSSEIGKSELSGHEIEVQKTRIGATNREHQEIDGDEPAVSAQAVETRFALAENEDRIQEAHTNLNSTSRRSERISILLTPRHSGLEEAGTRAVPPPDSPVIRREDQPKPITDNHPVQLETPRATQIDDPVFEYPDVLETGTNDQEVDGPEELEVVQANKETLSQQSESSPVQSQSPVQSLQSPPVDKLPAPTSRMGSISSTGPSNDSQSPEEPRSPLSPDKPDAPQLPAASQRSSASPSLQPAAVAALAPAAPATPEHPVTRASPTPKPASAPAPKSSPPTLPRASASPTTRGIRTSTSYYAPLAALAEHFARTTDVLAVAVHATAPQRAPRGPRDHHCALYLLDPGLVAGAPADPSAVAARVFRRQRSVLPEVRPGDVVLLRDFKVVAQGGRMGLLSTKASAWAVFLDGAVGDDGLADMRGPPVEFGDEELVVVNELREWWDGLDAGLRERLVARIVKGQTGEGTRKEVPSNLRQEKVKGKENQAAAEEASAEAEGLASPVTELEHRLRNGTVYTDRPQSSNGEKKLSIHELRDGRTYRDRAR